MDQKEQKILDTKVGVSNASGMRKLFCLLAIAVLVSSTFSFGQTKPPSLTDLPGIIGYCTRPHGDCSSPEWKQKTISLIRSVLESGARDFDAFPGIFDDAWFEQPTFRLDDHEAFIIQIYDLLKTYGAQGDLYRRGNNTIYKSAMNNAFFHRNFKVAQHIYENGGNPNEMFESSYQARSVIESALSTQEGCKTIQNWDIHAGTFNFMLTTSTIYPHGLNCLKSRGVDLTVTDKFGRNQFYWLLSTHSYTESLETYLNLTSGPLNDRLVPFSERDPSALFQTTALQRFYESDRENPRNLEIMKPYLDALKAQGSRMNWNFPDLRGANVLLQAVQEYSIERFRGFVSYGVDPKQLYQSDRGVPGRSLLFDSVLPNFVQELVSHGLDVNHQDTSGETPLMERVRQCNRYFFKPDYALETARALVAAEANTKIKNVSGQTAFDLLPSSPARCEEMRKLLSQHPH